MNGEKLRRIRTPEGVEFPLIIASPITRFLALLIDVLCVQIATGLAGIVVGVLGLLNSDWAGAAYALASAVLSLGYPILMEWRWRGQTLGKRVLRLQVMDEQGLRLQFSQVVIRNLLRAVDVLPGFYLVGGVSAWWSANGQRLGDFAASTIVVRHPAAEKPDFDQILPDKYNSFREHAHLAARLRQTTSAREAGLGLQALLRRDRFEDTARVRLFADLRAHFEQRVRFPAEVTEGLSDETYVRNVVDVLFR